MNGYEKGPLVGLAIVPVLKHLCHFGCHWFRNLSDPLTAHCCSGMHGPPPIGLLAHATFDRCDQTVSGLLQDDTDHLVTDASCFGEPRLKVFRDAFEAILVRCKIPKGNAIRPSASGKGKLEIIRAKSVVLNSGVDDFFQELWLAEKVLGDSEPESERLKGSILGPRN